MATYFLHDVDAETAAEGETYQRPEADIAFESVCAFTMWPAVKIRVLAGADDRFFPVGLSAGSLVSGSASRLTCSRWHLLPLVQPVPVANYLLQTTRRP